MIQFVDDDTGFEPWILDHPDGWVVNAERNPKPSYLRLHRSSCRQLQGTPANGVHWIHTYGKWCAEKRSEMDEWAGSVIGGELWECAFCVASTR